MTGATASNYVTVFGSILEAVGSVYSGYQNNSVAKYNAQVAEAQANLVESNIRTRNLITDTNIEIRNRRASKEMRYIEGEQVASYAKAGVKLTGSPIDVIVSSRANQELDLALTNLNDRMMTNQSNMTDTLTATGYRTQARLDKASGLSAISQGYANTAKSLLSAAVKYKSSSVLGKDTIGGTSGSSLYNKVGSDYSIGSRRW